MNNNVLFFVLKPWYSLINVFYFTFPYMNGFFLVRSWVAATRTKLFCDTPYQNLVSISAVKECCVDQNLETKTVIYVPKLIEIVMNPKCGNLFRKLKIKNDNRISFEFFK